MRIRSRTGLVVALALAAGGLTLLPGGSPRAFAAGLVPYSDCDELLADARRALVVQQSAYGDESFAVGGAPVPVAAGAERATADSSAGGATAAVGSGPTGTNLQEAGVDEPDTAKLVGDRLYSLSGGALRIVRTGAQPELLGSLALGPEAYGELLVQGDRVLLLLSTGGYGIAEDSVRGYPGGGSGGQVRLVLVDVADAAEPTVVEELLLDGRYLSARLAGGAVRLVTSSSPSFPQAYPAEPYGPEQVDAAQRANQRAAAQLPLERAVPQHRRTTAEGEVLSAGPAVACDQVSRSEGAAATSTLLVTTLDLMRGLEALDTDGVSTDGDLVYASADRLYVATSRWGTVSPAGGPEGQQVTTELHAFDTAAPDRTAYAGTGSVDGYVYGRWALSSHEGHLRVATTDAAPWGQQPTSSTVVVLAESPDGLTEVGRVGGLGPGERIYAVRYLGDLATVVTFRQTDPLYVLDLADPTAPRLLGELKVPGFSTYLHPVGDGRLLGLGMEADPEGRVTGAQVSLFDISDLSRPTQLDRLQLGQGWLSDDSRAFGYDVERGLALVPFGDETGRSSALGVRVEGDRLVEAGRVTVPVEAYVERVLHDAGHVYAVTQTGVVAADPTSLTPTGALRF